MMGWWDSRRLLRTRLPGGDLRSADGDKEEDANDDGRRFPPTGR